MKDFNEFKQIVVSQNFFNRAKTIANEYFSPTHDQQMGMYFTAVAVSLAMIQEYHEWISKMN